MNIARFSVTRPVAVTMAVSALVLLGVICLTRLPIDLLPKVSLPTVVVNTAWPNVGPEELEAQVTRPMEQALSSVPGLYQISSTTSEGSSSVRVQFQWGVDMGDAVVEVLQVVERARRRLPNDDTLQPPVVFRFDPTQQPILTYAVSGEPDLVKLRTLVVNQISPMIESADGVASAVVTGGRERSILVEPDVARLRAHHLTVDDVARRIADENLNLPGGVARQGSTEYTVRSTGWFGSTREIEQIPVRSHGGRLVALGDVATVRDSFPEPRAFTRLNGQASIGLSVSKQSGANTVSTADAVRARVREVERLYPHLKFAVAYDQAQFIAASMRELRDAAIIGAALAILILLFFLRNLRSTLVVALSIPVSITATFALLYIGGFTLNTMSLGGLALATGLIVDDAVVVLENIFRHIERDRKRAAEAAVSATGEISMAVLASTLTVMVVFLPLLLIRGQAGQMYTQFALVVIFSIAVSLLVAVTVVPMLASRLIQGEAHHENLADGHRRNLMERAFYRFGLWFERLDASYRGVLAWALRHRLAGVGAALLLTFGSLLLRPLIGTELMPQTDSGDFSINLKMPVGTALAVTNDAMAKAEEIVRSHPDVATAMAAVGSGSGRGLGANQGNITVRLKDPRSRSTLEVMGDLRKELGRLPGAMARPSQFDIVSMMLTGGNQNLQVVIFGENLAELSTLGRDVMGRLRNIPGLENVDVNWQDAAPEIQWRVDRRKALQLGVSFRDVAHTVEQATNGSIASYYQEGGYQYPILVRVPEGQRKTVDAMLNLVVRAGDVAAGRPDVLLREVAVPVYGIGPSQVTRQDRQRFISVSGQPQGRSPSEIQAEIERELSDVAFPAGYYWDWGTNQKRRDEEFAGLGLAVFLAVALIYMLLAAQFESFVHPLTVLLSVPLSIVGVVLALFLTNRSFGLTAFIGLLMLVGIVVKNGILLVDYTNVLRGRGVPRDEAVLTAGPTRLRPVLMTTAATVLGMLPIAIGLGKGSETQAPMATAVIGGLITSTALTLLVVPTVYTLFDDLGRWLRRNRRDLAPSSIVEPSLGAYETDARAPAGAPAEGGQ